MGQEGIKNYYKLKNWAVLLSIDVKILLSTCFVDRLARNELLYFEYKQNVLGK